MALKVDFVFGTRVSCILDEKYMNRKQMISIGTIVLFAVVGVLAWNMIARAAYESAEYKVVEAEEPGAVKWKSGAKPAYFNPAGVSQPAKGRIGKRARYLSTIICFGCFRTSASSELAA